MATYTTYATDTYYSHSTTSTDNVIWNSWSDSATSTAVNGPTTTTWTYWVDSGTGNGQNQWIRWNSQAYYVHQTPTPPPVFEEPTAWKELEEKKRLAEEKSQEMLKLLIGQEQHAVFKRTKKLIVKGSDNGLYLLNKEGGFLKRITEEKKLIENFCVHLHSEYKFKLPETDNILALLLGLRHNEKEVIKLANPKHTEALVQIPEAAVLH